MKNAFVDFVKEHKKEIIIGVGITCGVVAGVLIFKNRTAIETLIKKTTATGLKTSTEFIPVKLEIAEELSVFSLPENKIINVSEHIRNLPEGWKPSQSKIDLAALNDLILEENQTIVSAYVKTAA